MERHSLHKVTTPLECVVVLRLAVNVINDRCCKYTSVQLSGGPQQPSWWDSNESPEPPPPPPAWVRACKGSIMERFHCIFNMQGKPAEIEIPLVPGMDIKEVGGKC